MVDNPTPQGTPLPTVNPIESGIDTAVSNTTTISETLLDKAAETAEPLLATPVIKQLFEALVKWLLGVASKTGELFLTFTINKAQGAAQDSALQSAEQEVQIAIQGGNADAIAKAEKDFQTAESSAVNSGGSATPQ
jgi:hypothetical protein